MKSKFLLVFVAIILVFGGCSQQDATQDVTNGSDSHVNNEGENTSSSADEDISPEGVLSPSQIDVSLVDTYVKVRGKINLFHQDSGGVALWLSDGKGKVGIRIESDDWENLSAEQKAEYKTGNTITAEGMLVLTPTQELFVVLGTAPPSEGRPAPKFAKVEIVAGPVNISKQPKGSLGWPWPKIFLRGDRIILTYRGEIDSWPSQWLIESEDGINWSEPLELPPGEVVIGEKGAFTLSAWKYTDEDDMGAAGVVLNVLDEDFALEESIVVDTRTALHSVDRATFPVGAIDSQGNFHIAWAADTGAGTDVFYAMYNGSELSEAVSVSNSPDMGSINHYVAVDGDGVVYITYSESPRPWDPETEGGYPDDFYTYLENGVWSEPRNISNTPDWGEYGMAIFANGSDMHTFYIPSRMTEPGQMRYVQIRKEEIIREEIANFSFTDISMVFDGDKIHAVHGGWGYKNAYEGPDSELVLEGKVYYTYFDGEDWYAGMGAELLTQEFLDNSENPILVAESIQTGHQDTIIMENGESSLYREIRPETVCKDGLFYTVFEHIQDGTADAYLVIFRPDNP